MTVKSWIFACSLMTLLATSCSSSAKETGPGNPYKDSPRVDYRDFETKYPAPEIETPRNDVTIDQGPFVFFDSTPSVLVAKDDRIVFEATLDWIDAEIEPKSAVVSLEVRELPKGEPIVIKQEWLDALRPGGKLVFEYERSFACGPAVFVVWGLEVDGQRIKAAHQGLTKFIETDPRCPAQPPSTERPPIIINTPVDGSDNNPGDGLCLAVNSGKCSLRAAVEETNALAGPQSVGFKPGINPVMARGSAPLEIRGALQLLGNGQNVTIISATEMATLFHTLAADPAIPGSEAGELTLSGLTISVSAGGPASNAFSGQQHVLLNESVATLDDVTAYLRPSAQSAASMGDLITTTGHLVVRQSRLRRVGGWYNDNALLEHVAGTTLIEASTIFGSSGHLVQIGPSGSIVFVNSTIAQNTNQKYQALANQIGSTALFQTAYVPAGAARLRLNISNTTITDTPYLDMAWGVFDPKLGGQVRMSNSLISGVDGGCGGNPVLHNTTQPPISPPYVAQPIWIVSSGHNLIDDLGACELLDQLRRPASGDITGFSGAPLSAGLLAPVLRNGEEVYRLSPTSPARDAGNPLPPDPNNPLTCRPYDQTDIPRPQNGRCDIGSTEQ